MLLTFESVLCHLVDLLEVRENNNLADHVIVVAWTMVIMILWHGMWWSWYCGMECGDHDIVAWAMVIMILRHGHSDHDIVAWNVVIMILRHGLLWLWYWGMDYGDHDIEEWNVVIMILKHGLWWSWYCCAMGL